MQSSNQNQGSNFQISDIISIAKNYGWALVRFSWLILILSVLLGSYLYYSKLSIPTTYTGTYSLILDESSGTDQGYLQQVLGDGLFAASFGGELDPAGGSQAAMLKELLHTRKILNLTLFVHTKLKYPDNKIREDLLINHFIELSGLRTQWVNAKSSLADFRFTHDSIANFSRQENGVLLTICGMINRICLDEDISPNGIFRLYFKSQNETLTFHFLHTLFNKLDEYYTKQSIAKQQKIYEAAVSRRDLLEKEMELSEKRYINYLNRHGAVAKGRYEQEIETQFLARKLSGEMEAYFMAIKNVEAAKIALEQQKPLLQPIDPPIYPLASDRPNASLYLIIGSFAGAFIGVVLVIGIKFLSNFLKAQKKNQPTTKPTVPTA